MKTSQLIGTALDWAVELAKGTSWSDKGYFVFKNPDGTTRAVSSRPEWCYSTDWSQGGPIIERYAIGIRRIRTIETWHWEAGPILSSKLPSYGDTPLIAAMRCLVASKLGDEVEIPQEILTQS